MPSFGRDQRLGRAGRERDGGVVFLEHDAGEREAPAGVLAQRLRAGRGEVLVGLLHLGVADQLVEEAGADQREHAVHGLALELGLDVAQHLAALGLDVGAGGPEHEVDRLLGEAELVEVVVERRRRRRP